MDQGRIEPTPAEQLSELRKARDRYAALAEKLHEGAVPELEPDEKLAQEQDALRILHAYERSVANSEVRMNSLGKTQRLPGRPLGVRTWLLIFVAISAIEGGVLLAYFRPAFFAPVMQLTGARPAPPAALPAPPQPAAAAPIPAAPIPAPPIATPPKTPIAKPQPNPPQPAARPQAVAPPVKPAPKPAAPPARPPQSASPPQPAAPRPAPSPGIAPPAASPPPPQAAPQQTPPTITAAPPPTVSLPQAQPQQPQPQPVQPQQAQPQQAQPQQAPPAPRPARLEAVAGTHTPPPYPDAAKRLGETGTTQIRIAVTPQGGVSDCRIVKSSGSSILDAAACSHVQTNWRWRPAAPGSAPAASNLDVTIVWNLRDAR